MKKKLLCLAVAVTVLAGLATGCARGSMTGANNTASGSGESTGQETYTWRMAHEEYTGDMQDVYCKEFAEKLNEKPTAELIFRFMV